MWCDNCDEDDDGKEIIHHVSFAKADDDDDNDDSDNEVGDVAVNVWDYDGYDVITVTMMVMAEKYIDFSFC